MHDYTKSISLRQMESFGQSFRLLKGFKYRPRPFQFSSLSTFPRPPPNLNGCLDLPPEKAKEKKEKKEIQSVKPTVNCTLRLGYSLPTIYRQHLRTPPGTGLESGGRIEIGSSQLSEASLWTVHLNHQRLLLCFCEEEKV